MAQNSLIQWCDHTVNPVSGCGGCELWMPDAPATERRCYAAQLTELRRGRNPHFAADFGVPQLYPARVAKMAREGSRLGKIRRQKGRVKPWLDGARTLVFLSDMGDALSEGSFVRGRDVLPEGGGIPFTYLHDEIVRVAASESGRRHTWLWLTKRPKRLAKFARWLRDGGIPWPENLWPGTSITSSASLGRFPELQAVGAPTAFLSVEPLWEEVSLAAHLESAPSVRWLIVGGESGQGAATPHEFHVEWARRIRDECRDLGRAFFMKQLGPRPRENGQELSLADNHGGEWTEWADDLRLRELPQEAYFDDESPALGDRRQWTAEDAHAWVRGSNPGVRAGISALLRSHVPLTTSRTNELSGAHAGGAIVGGVLRTATVRNLQPPLRSVEIDGTKHYVAANRHVRDLLVNALSTNHAARGPIEADENRVAGTAEGTALGLESREDR